MPEVVKQGFLTAVVIPELQLVPLALRQGRDWVVHYDERPPLAIVSNIDRVVVVCGEEQVVEIFDPRNRLRNRQGRPSHVNIADRNSRPAPNRWHPNRAQMDTVQKQRETRL
jgi:hypothetical protein